MNITEDNSMIQILAKLYSISLTLPEGYSTILTSVNISVEIY